MTGSEMLAAGLLLAMVAITGFVQPRNGTLQKWVYFFIAPLLGTLAAVVYIGNPSAAVLGAFLSWTGVLGIYWQFRRSD